MSDTAWGWHGLVLEAVNAHDSVTWETLIRGDEYEKAGNMGS